VLRVIARLNVGGPALHVAYLTEGLDRLGYETLLVAGTVSPGEASMERVALDRGITPLILPELQREIDPWSDLRGVLRLRALVRRWRPDIVHTHTAKAGTVGRVAALLAREERPPVLVHTFHGHVLSGYFGRAASAGFRMAERALARRTDVLVAVSPEVRADLVRFGLDPERIRVIRLGLDLDERTRAEPGARAALRAELGVAAGRPLIGWVGRMTQIKRVDALLAAVALVPDCELVLVGDGPLRGALEAQARSLGIAGRCHFNGFREELGPVYAACDIVALSSANEGTPVTLIEALAAGVPVVTTDVGGVREVVRDGVTGLLATPGDAESLGGRINALVRDAALRARLGSSGRADVRRRFTIERLVADVDLLYRDLLAGR
jgi:glycosyltransferase involved in cell wall biosynthesis